ncbi:MAG: TetR family transcriptional regulator [Microbacterium sp.]|uniref:TetR/AcrR family transcriptional regulator n=1 Tax=unclassified Microbacterium TaxID=2609290 RepID=UPI000C4624B8|nr:MULTISPECIES: TetR/AcrR family transcriptional regulator [unclassified Microbacterium]MAY50336.1 TetR family transcriptional regulator [Microbacterium sp.]HBR89081.1 TetR family transcriptional regulator [Microbacterium sp.]HBS73672.1 TetR family transcriptional regulator [Microbacterium sp.]|tara:strand:- start:13747 stop:14340 length:594 start_codon:yes stop_codon:yes gene_type:complete
MTVTDRRGGAPRSEAARLAILRATARLFLEKGFGQLSIEGIAAEAGVGKQTIYRWWPTKSDLVAEALIEGMLMPEQVVPRFDGTLRDDLARWMRTVLAFVDDPEHDEMLKSLVAAGTINPAIGERVRDNLGADADLVRRLEQGVSDGELPAEAPIASIVELLIGAIVLRIVARSDADDGEAERLVDIVLGRYAPARE